MNWSARVLLPFAAAATGCRHDRAPAAPQPFFAPGEIQTLSVGSPGKDEDPSVLRAGDGRMLVAWFSDRTGNADLFVTSTRDGRDWSAPVQATQSLHADYYPSLLQDDQGLFHLTWFRWNGPATGSIFTNTSLDGVSWNPATEVQVTRTPLVDDWVPCMAQAADGALLIWFVATRRDPQIANSELYVTRKLPTETDWPAATRVVDLSSPTEHDHLPCAVRIGSELRMVWVRSDTRQPVPWQNPKADLYTATSVDGLAWTTPVRITDDVGDVVNVFPALYADLGGAWSLVWLSTRTGQPRVYEIPLLALGQYPGGRVENTWLTAGYSHRIAATPNPGVYLAAWVEGPEGSQDIAWRLYRR